MPADDEQGVIRPHREPEHDRQGRCDGRNVDHMSRQPDDGQTTRQGDDRRGHRQRRGDEGAEGEEQDDQGGEHADDHAEAGAGTGELLAEVAAGRDLDPCIAGRLCCVEDAVPLVVVEVARGDLEGHRDVGDRPVLGDVRGPLLAEWADHRLDVLVARQGLHGRVDGLLVLSLGEGGARLEDDRDAAVGLLRQVLVEQIGGGLGARSGQRHVVVLRAAGGIRDHHKPDREHHPRSDHPWGSASSERSDLVHSGTHCAPSPSIAILAYRDAPTGTPGILSGSLHRNSR